MCNSRHILLIALMVHSGLAIKCFNCDSASNEGCEKMTDKTIQAEECDDDKQRELESQFDNHNRHWLLKISDIHYHRPPKSKSDSVKMTCQKLVGIDEQKKETIVRRCQLVNVYCNYSEQQLTALFPKNFKIDFCESCEDKDGCNGSSSTQALGIMIGGVMVFTLFRHFL